MGFEIGDMVRLNGTGWNHYDEKLPDVHNGLVVEIVDTTIAGGNFETYNTDGEQVILYVEDTRQSSGGMAKTWGGDLVSYGNVTASPYFDGENHDPVNSPNYYMMPDGAEVVSVSKWLTSAGAQAVQYIARATRIDGVVKDDPIEDLDKAEFWIKVERERLLGLR